MEEINKKNLFIEINDVNFIIVASEYDDQLNFKILEKKVINSIGIQNGKIIDIDKSSQALKKGINSVEEKINFVFRKAYLVLDQNDIECINICGFKKLNGNQIISEDITYILNDLKNKINDVEKDKSILHLFNTEFILDKKTIKNLPIGLYGNFYSHQLTFFLIKNNEIDNFQKLLNNCNLNLNKIILKNFTSGINLINNEKKDTFLKVIIKKESSQIIYFNNSAFNFFQNFQFGSNLIIKDVSKVCSLRLSNAEELLNDICFDNKNLSETYLDNKYFKNQEVRKISLGHVREVIAARVKEIVDLVINQNTNLQSTIPQNIPIFLFFEDKKIFSNLSELFKEFFTNKNNLNIKNVVNNADTDPIKISGELISRGWVREAIPVTQKKKSFISRIFSTFFD